MFQPKHRYKWKIFIYILLLSGFLLLLSSVMIYVQMRNTIRSQSITAGQNMLIQIKNSSDLLMYGIDSSLHRIQHDYDVIHYVDNFRFTNHIERRLTRENISSTLIANYHFRSIYIHFFDDYVTLDPSFCLIRGTAVPSGDVVRRAVDLYTHNNEMSLFWDDDDSNENLLTFLRPMPQFSEYPRGLIIFSISKDYLYDITRSINVVEQAIILVTDNEGNVISMRADRIQPEFQAIDFREVVQDLRVSEDNILTLYVGGNNYIGIMVESDKYHWNYIYLYPYSEIQNQIAKVRDPILFVAVICIIFAIIISFGLSIRIYNPIKFLRNRNLGLEKTLKEQIPLVKNNFIQSLIWGELDSDCDFAEKIRHYEVNLYFPGSYIVCLMMHENWDSKEISGNRIGLSKMMQRDTVALALLDYPDIKYEIVQVSMKLAVLILSFHKYDKSVDIRRLLENISEGIKQCGGVHVSISAGEECFELQDIPYSYAQAQKSMEYGWIKGPGSIILYEEIAGKEATQSYPYDLERGLTESLYNFRQEATTDFLQRFANHVRNLPNPSIAKFQYARLYDGIIRFLSGLGEDVLSVDGGNVCESVMEAKSIEDMYEIMENLIKTLYQHLENKKIKSRDAVVDLARQHILENYTNPDITVSSVAQSVYLSDAHLNRRYKEVTGKSIKEHIIALRIAEAIRYLEQTTLSISKISRLVGYPNEQAFIKIFKKHTYRTPTEMRMWGTIREREI